MLKISVNISIVPGLREPVSAVSADPTLYGSSSCFPQAVFPDSLTVALRALGHLTLLTPGADAQGPVDGVAFLTPIFEAAELFHSSHGSSIWVGVETLRNHADPTPEKKRGVSLESHQLFKRAFKASPMTLAKLLSAQASTP